MRKSSKPRQSMAVFDDQMVGTVVERSDGHFDAFDTNKVHLGTFADVAAASRAIPKLVDARRAQERRTRRAGRGRS
jgi:hypothetical protein